MGQFGPLALGRVNNDMKAGLKSTFDFTVHRIEAIISKI